MGLAFIHRINEFHATTKHILCDRHDSGTRCRPVLLQVSSITFCKFLVTCSSLCGGWRTRQRSMPQIAKRCARTARNRGQPPTAIDRLGWPMDTRPSGCRLPDCHFRSCNRFAARHSRFNQAIASWELSDGVKRSGLIGVWAMQQRGQILWRSVNYIQYIQWIGVILTYYLYRFNILV